jgi:hypothetical protein
LFVENKVKVNKYEVNKHALSFLVSTREERAGQSKGWGTGTSTHIQIEHNPRAPWRAILSSIPDWQQ